MARAVAYYRYHQPAAKRGDGLCHHPGAENYWPARLGGTICEPVMALWGLPGEAATVLLAALMSMGGAVGVAASLATAGALTGHDVTVLLPAMYLMGNPVQNVGRCLGTAEVNAKYYPHIITVCVINALLSIWVMQLIV